MKKQPRIEIIDLALKLYFEEYKSSIEIAEYFKENNICDLTPRSIQRYIKRFNTPRKPHQHRILALYNNRLTRMIPQTLYIKRRIMDDYKCQNCGEYRLVLLKVAKISEPAKNQPLTTDNLLTLCKHCL